MVTFCAEHGPDVHVDEDGCCELCGGTAMGPAVVALSEQLGRLDKQIDRARASTPAPSDHPDVALVFEGACRLFAASWVETRDSGSCTTQLDTEKGELANVDDWRRNAIALFTLITRERDDALRKVAVLTRHWGGTP